MSTTTAIPTTTSITPDPATATPDPATTTTDPATPTTAPATPTAAPVVPKWDHEKQGADWKDLEITDNKCGSGQTQSPINLIMPKKENKMKHLTEDSSQKMYTNQVGDIEIEWDGHVSKFAINKAGQEFQWF